MVEIMICFVSYLDSHLIRKHKFLAEWKCLLAGLDGQYSAQWTYNCGWRKLRRIEYVQEGKFKCCLHLVPMMAPRRTFPKTTGPMDQWLETQGYYRKHTARDGSCLFRAISEQIFYTQSVHENVRQQCVNYIQRHKEKFEKLLEEPFADYIVRMMNPKEWGGIVEIKAMALLYKFDVLIFEEVCQLASPATDYGFTRKLYLCFSPDNHYDSVYPKEYIVRAAFCQSLVYEVLYKNVFKLSDVNYAVNKMLHDKTSRLQKERFIHEDNLLSCGRFGFSMEISLEAGKEYKDGDEMNNNVKEILAQGSTPFPYKVAKALDPNIYRNIEFDIWNDYRRELKFGWYRNNGEFQVGVKCLVKLNPERNFHAHIQEMSPDKGPVIVYVEELGEKCTVPYDNLEPLPNAEKQQWPLPYKHCRQLSSIQQKSALLALQELGGKWKKSRVTKSRKIKENQVHTPVSPRLQYNSKMNNSTKFSSPQNNRYLRENIGNQQMQVPFQNFSQENYNNLPSYNNAGMDTSSVATSLIIEQPNLTSNPAMSQAMIMPLNCTSSSGNTPLNTTQSINVSSSSERCLSPVQEPDSTTPDLPPTQQLTANSQLPIESATTFSPAQFISFASYPNQPQVPVPTTLPRPECNVTTPCNGITPSCFSDSSTAVSPQGVYSTGTNLSYANISAGSEQLTRDMNGNILLQPVNFMAQKSMHISGSDLPLSDLPTLRFYYNLGHDYLRLSCMYWPTTVPQAKPNFTQQSPAVAHNENISFVNPISSSNNLIAANEHHTSDPPTMPEGLYQFGQDLLSTEQGTSEENKGICFHAGNGDSECVPWQVKQTDAEVMPKEFNNGSNSRFNKNSINGRDEKTQNVRSHQNPARPNEQFDTQTTVQQSQDIDSTYGQGVNELRSSVQSLPSNVIATNYTVPPPTMPYTYTAVSPTVYNQAVVPFYYPIENEQAMLPVQYFSQYTVSPPMQLPQETGEPATNIAESQNNAAQHTTGSICQSPTVDNSCFPQCTIYPSPPPPPPSTPVLYQQTTSMPIGLYTTGTGSVANMSVSRWMQTASNPPHMTPTPCLLQTPPMPSIAGSHVGYNTSAI